MTLRELREKRARTIAAMREITDAPKGVGGDLDEAQEQRFNTLKGELSALDKQIERQTLLDEADRRAEGTPINGSGDDRLDALLDETTLQRTIIAQLPAEMRGGIDCGREIEASNELARVAGIKPKGMAISTRSFRQRVLRGAEQRVLTTLLPAGGPGSNLIQTDVRGDLYIDLLRSAILSGALGATILSDLVGNVAIPQKSVGSTARWVAENAAITASDFEHDQVSMTPKHVGCLAEYSRNLLLQTSPDIEQLLRADFAAALALAVDAGALRGGGSNEPSGIIANSNVSSHDMNTGPTWDAILGMIAEVEVGNALMGSLGWAAAPRCVKKMRGTVKVTSTDSVMIQESPNELAGYPLRTTTTLLGATGSPAVGELIFGNWRDLVIGYWSVLDILVNPYESTAYSKGNVQIRGMITCDVALRHNESFRKVTNMAVA